jgi:hypothetical protein
MMIIWIYHSLAMLISYCQQASSTMGPDNVDFLLSTNILDHEAYNWKRRGTLFIVDNDMIEIHLVHKKFI